MIPYHKALRIGDIINFNYGKGYYLIVNFVDKHSPHKLSGLHIRSIAESTLTYSSDDEWYTSPTKIVSLSRYGAESLVNLSHSGWELLE